MGLNYSYLLYFKREHLQQAFRGLEEIAESINPPIINFYPNYSNLTSTTPNDLDKTLVHHNGDELDFATVLKFDLDDEIQEYLRAIKDEESFRSPPKIYANQGAIGFIYLTVYNKLSEKTPKEEKEENLILFEFGTTGTKMSMLFDYSPSIRETFIRLTEKNQGICAVFNREVDWPELLWLKGKRYSKSIKSAFMLPNEIERSLNEGW